jgi:hypothetical protein
MQNKDSVLNGTFNSNKLKGKITIDSKDSKAKRSVAMVVDPESDAEFGDDSEDDDEIVRTKKIKKSTNKSVTKASKASSTGAGSTVNTLKSPGESSSNIKPPVKAKAEITPSTKSTKETVSIIAPVIASAPTPYASEKVLWALIMLRDSKFQYLLRVYLAKLLDNCSISGKLPMNDIDVCTVLEILQLGLHFDNKFPRIDNILLRNILPMIVMSKLSNSVISKSIIEDMIANSNGSYVFDVNLTYGMISDISKSMNIGMNARKSNN